MVDIGQDPSSFLLRLDPEEHTLAMNLASRYGVSLNTLVRHILRFALVHPDWALLASAAKLPTPNGHPVASKAVRFASFNGRRSALDVATAPDGTLDMDAFTSELMARCDRLEEERRRREASAFACAHNEQALVLDRLLAQAHPELTQRIDLWRKVHPHPDALTEDEAFELLFGSRVKPRSRSRSKSKSSTRGRSRS